jgi:hypothetical protein
MKCLILVVLLSIISACTGIQRTDPELLFIDQSKIAAPDLTVTIPGLGSCTDSTNRTLHLNSQEPVIVLVHGCLGSAGRFRALAEVFAFSGQQAICFSYNDRDSLMVSSAQLVSSLDALRSQMQGRNITLIGHSQGGLIARKAMVSDRSPSLQTLDADLTLVTVSAPFAGINAASHCGSTLAKILSLGLTVPICKIVSGDKWDEITASSEFILQPGVLLEQVGKHLKINTDESGSCRSTNGVGSCMEDDYVFSLEEQYHPPVDRGAAVANVDIKAGHVEIAGDQRVAPLKFIAVLQQHGILKTTPPERISAFESLLARLYTTDGTPGRPGTDYGPGVGWPEDRNTTHWLESRETHPAVEISVDIVSQEKVQAQKRW